MYTRRDIAEVFSTFAQFEANRFTRWVSDGKLRRSIQLCQEKCSETQASDEFWALFWYKQWLLNHDRLTTLHLSAYLQEACYWAAENTNKRFSSPQYSVVDYFQMAIAEVSKVLVGFKPEKSSSLKAYGMMAFSSLLKAILRQRHDADICGNWSLLRKVGRRRMVQALQYAGLSPEAIARYQLGWKCFKELYTHTKVGGTQQLPEPDKKLWEAIANLYNTERHGQLASPGSEIDGGTAEKWLRETAISIRAYLYPAIKSLDEPKPGYESNQDWDLPEDLRSESMLSEMLAEEDRRERKSQISQMHDVLVAVLGELPAELQQILQMYYKQGLTQQEIAKKLEEHQVKISRRLNKARELLLEELVKWSQKEWGKNPLEVYKSSKSKQVDNRSDALEEWLQLRQW
jgi:RNA polymerase sigma factor (sigma-70 family)